MLKVGSLQLIVKRTIMNNIVFLLVLIFNFNIYANSSSMSDLNLSSNSVLNTSNISNYYVNQLDSRNKPYTSCVSAVGKMVCNILCNNTSDNNTSDNNSYCANSLTDISLLLGTTDEGAYIDDLMDILNQMDTLTTSDMYISDIDMLGYTILQELDRGNLIVVSAKTGKLSSIYPNTSETESYNHCLLLIGFNISGDGENVRIILRDPMERPYDISISLKELLNSLNGNSLYIISNQINQSENMVLH